MALLRIELTDLGDGRCQVRADGPGLGETAATTLLPYDGRQDRWRTLYRALDRDVFQPQAFAAPGELAWMVQAGFLTADGRAFHPDLLVHVGRELYRTLFPAKVEDALTLAVAEAERGRMGLHIQLRFAPDAGAPVRFAEYPWELAHDGRGFLELRRATFSRYIAYSAPPPAPAIPQRVHILLVSSTAAEAGSPPLPEAERRAMRDSLQTAREEGCLELAELGSATVERLRAYLADHRGAGSPTVIHFDGHGAYGIRCANKTCRAMNAARVTNCRACGDPLGTPRGYLLFEQGDEGVPGARPAYVSAGELGALLGEAGLGDQGVALVVLTACYSGLAAAGPSAFNGVAQNLIDHGVPAAVAMQHTVGVSAARAFVAAFYRALGHGVPVPGAISAGREAMGVEDNQWYRPVLYMRWAGNEGGRLFNATFIEAGRQQVLEAGRRLGAVRRPLGQGGIPMDAVSVVLTALAAGAVAASKDTAGDVVKDAYAGLKGLVQRRFTDMVVAGADEEAASPAKNHAETALVAYEQDPETWEKPLRKALEQSGADQDDTILEAAQKLYELAKPTAGLGTGVNVSSTGGRRTVTANVIDRSTINTGDRADPPSRS